MDRQEALAYLAEKVSNENLRKHSLAVEAIMRRLAGRFGGDADQWALAGLLHDIDYDVVGMDPEKHAAVGGEWLAERGLSPEIVEAVKGHNDKAPRTTPMAKALYAVDPTSGFITACALITREKSLAPVDLAFMQKRFKEKRFAARASREGMAACSELGMSLDDFLSEALAAMKEAASDLGL
ncbi:MAG TPA: HD domain-containing protein [Planctomycetota bacterium]|nr:HD domain-containing protein [Planctomycetota bacterium]